jgi:hypothetical protein
MHTYRYGELRTATFTIVVSKKSENSSTALLPVDFTASSPRGETMGEQSVQNEEQANATTMLPYPVTLSPVSDQEEYQRQFFLLKVNCPAHPPPSL